MGILNKIISLSLCLSVILVPYSVNEVPVLTETFTAGGTATASLYGSKYSASVSAQTNGPIPCITETRVYGTYMGASGHKMWSYGNLDSSNNAHSYSSTSFSNCASCYWVDIDGDHIVIKNGITYPTYHTHITL